MIPALLVLLAVLSIIPVGQAALELIIHRVTVDDVVDRRAFSDNLVSLDGYTLLVPFPAQAPDAPSTAGATYHWYALSGDLGSQRLLLMRSSLSADALRTRTLVARLVDDPAAVQGARDELARRGVTSPAGSPATRLLVEIEQPNVEVHDISTLRDVANLASGEVVRLRLRTEDGVATCAGRGSCDARALAAGLGSWDNMAIDPQGDGWAILRTGYPPSQVPFHGVGRQQRESDAVAGLLSSAPAHMLLGWAFVLQTAFVDHDPNLPIDHLWLGPLMFSGLAGLLLLGQRLGYPRFVAQRVAGQGDPAGREGAAKADPAIVPCRATGRISPPGASPFEISDEAATMEVGPAGANHLILRQGTAARMVTIPAQLGGLGMIEIGVIQEAWRRRPALRVGWFGSTLLLDFDDAKLRDGALRLLRRQT